MAVEGIESADFLDAGQKRDIFYNNAVRFLKLDEAILKTGEIKSESSAEPRQVGVLTLRLTTGVPFSRHPPHYHLKLEVVGTNRP